MSKRPRWPYGMGLDKRQARRLRRRVCPYIAAGWRCLSCEARAATRNATAMMTPEQTQAYFDQRRRKHR